MLLERVCSVLKQKLYDTQVYLEHGGVEFHRNTTLLHQQGLASLVVFVDVCPVLEQGFCYLKADALVFKDILSLCYPTEAVDQGRLS